MDCILIPVQGRKAILVPVLVDEGAESAPEVLDLDPWRYLHKSKAQRDQVNVLERSTITVHRYPRDGIELDHPYTIFYTRKVKPSLSLLNEGTLTDL